MRPHLQLRATLSAVLLASMLTLIAVPATAQPGEGSIVLSAIGSSGGFYYLKPAFPVQQLVKVASGSVNCLRTQHGSFGMMAGTSGNSPAILRFTPTGSAVTYATMPSGYWPSSIELDQDGSYIVTATNAIFRLNGTTLTTLTRLRGSWNAICRDKDRGDFMVGRYSDGRLLRLDRVNGSLATVSIGLGANTVSGVAYIPQNARYAVSRLNHARGLAIVAAWGGIVKEVAISSANAVTVDEKTGTIYVATTDGKVMRTSKDGVVSWTRDFGSQLFTGIQIWGYQNVSLTAPGVRGGEQKVTLRFNRSKNMPYCCALSFGMRPGIATGGGRTLNLRPDDLFFLTACKNLPGLTHAFTGTTSSFSGLALPKFTIPSAVPSGTRIYFGAVAVNPRMPGGLDVSNVDVVKVWSFQIR